MLSVEQCSSEITAKFKASLISGETLIDLTGGMGVDVAYMSKNFKNTFYFEQNIDLLSLTKYNFEQLGINNVSFLEGNSVEKLAESTLFDSKQIQSTWIYLDPHRTCRTPMPTAAPYFVT